MKVALVYDRVNKIGGAERVLLALHEIWPQAPLFTSVYDEEGAPWAKVFPQIIPSFLQKFPLAKKHHEAYAWLMPLAFESFSANGGFDDYDLVISVTSEAAKGIIAKPQTTHLCYCLTPTRYLWQSYEDYFKNGILKILSRPVVDYLRSWDKIAGQRPDFMVAISNNVAKRIKKYYGREAEVIYPPAGALRSGTALHAVQNLTQDSLCSFRSSQSGTPPRAPSDNNYFLVVSRLVPYKKIDLAIEAFNKMGLPLKIVGDGVEKKKLMRMAKPNIEFLGQNLTDEELIEYYKNCQAVIFPGEEDLGLVPLEAQSCGKPVIAFGKGGVLETVVEGKTGAFFLPQTKEALIKCLKGLILRLRSGKGFKSEDCIKNAQRFNKERFKEKFKKYAENCVK